MNPYCLTTGFGRAERKIHKRSTVGWNSFEPLMSPQGIADPRDDHAPTRNGRFQMHEQPNDSAAVRSVPCPECGAPADYPCDGISTVSVVMPYHTERIEAACEVDAVRAWRRANGLPEIAAPIDAVRALAACYDEQLLRSDHVVDDLFGGDGLEPGRGWLRLEADFTGEYQTVLSRNGRQAIVALLNADQAEAEAAE